MNRLTAIVVILAALSSAAAEDWPQFLGPQRDNISRETGLIDTFGEEGPTELWSVKVGPGFAGPAARDGQVFLLDRKGDTDDVLRCFDLETGEELWNFAYAAPGTLDYNGSRTTAAVDEEYVFTVGPFGHFHCISRETHQPVWSKHLLADFGAKRPNWGVSTSPLLYGDWVIVAPVGDKAGVIACDRATGEIVWQSQPIGSMEYASPMPATIGGVEQILMLAKRGNVINAVGIDAADGEVLWSYDGWSCGIEIPSPHPVGDGRVFLTGGYGAGSVMIQITGEGGSFSAEEVWRVGPEACGSQIHAPILKDGYLYVISNDNREAGGLTCVDAATGEIKWRTGRRPNFERGGIVMADGKLWVVDGRRATLTLVEPTPEEYREVASHRVLSTRNAWAPLAVSNGRLLLRDQENLRCLDVRGE